MALHFPAATSDTSHSRLGEYQWFDANPVCGALGVEIEGIDLSTSLSDAVLEELNSALLNHLVLFFRAQTLDARQLVRLGRHFGELHINPFGDGHHDAPEVMLVRSEQNEELRFAGKWHSDISWDEHPSMGSILYAVKVPGFGGDTLFANMYLACEAFSPPMREIAGRLKAVHTVDRQKFGGARYGDRVADSVIHPVLRTHPDTKRQALYVNEYFTCGIEGMSQPESAALLRYFFAHIMRPDFGCRFRWEPGSLAFWDNRVTQHYATNDYPGFSRLMHRVTIVGERPF